MELRILRDHQIFNQQGLTKKIIFDTPDVLCFILNLLPGQTIPPHQHERSMLIATVLSGQCTVEVSGEKATLSEGLILMVNGEETFGIPEVKSDLSLYVTLSPNPANPAYSKGIG